MPMRTHYCGLLREKDVGEQVSVCGWVDARRDHGGVLFIDLRDHTGLLQVVCDPSNPAAFEAGDRLRGEHVVRFAGLLRSRPEGMANPREATGAVEVYAAEVELLNEAATPAFFPGDTSASEETRLRHRIIDLRSAGMQQRLRLRHSMARAVRETADELGCIEIETPMLTRPTPEGARDFLVPARFAPGSCYALPQSPQLFKQMLMAGGFDRYCQLARCFRDEDLRADRQPEFTQIDIEMAFADEEEVMEAGEAMLRACWQAAKRPLPDAIPRMQFAEAMELYGCDAPDMRNPLQLTELRELAQGCGFRIFASAADAPGSRVAGLNVPGGADAISRKQIDDLTDFARSLGAGGLAYLKVTNPGAGAAGVTSPIAKFLGDSLIDNVAAACGCQAGDLLLFGAGPAHEVNGYMAPVRDRIGSMLDLLEPADWPVWITDFPLFLADPHTGKLACTHHPFTAPVRQDEDKLCAGKDLASLRSRAYDLVVNGQEIGGGSIRIHRRSVQLGALSAIGIDEDEAEDKFGFLLSCLDHGAPPHGGIAFGFDRMVALACDAESIREVIAFPKTQTGACLLTGAPHPVAASQLAESGLAPLAPEAKP